MTLTFSHGPLSEHPPATVNYDIHGPHHRLLLDAFPRRVRAIVGEQTIADSTAAKLLHETNHLPQLYLPERDVRFDLLTPTDHSTHCPFKGDAAYWSITVDGRVTENAAWSYPEPLPTARWLRGYIAFYWGAVDRWLDEDEEIEGHPRDPYHRVDVRPSSRHVRVLAGAEVLADTKSPQILSETGLGNRFYIPPEDVRDDLLAASETHTICPYKGVASYWGARTGNGERLENIAWAYPEPFDEALRIRGHLSFSGDGVSVEVDGERID